MNIVHPDSTHLSTARNQLLQQCMRPKSLPFPVETEYPIVLGSSGTSTSYCLLADNDPHRVIAHANLWPRILRDHNHNTEYKVGLIGNVATAPEFRGQGLMKHLFQELKEQAQKQNLDALILWSDLIQFYQNLGFVSQGYEWRFWFKSEVLAANIARKKGWTLIAREKLNKTDLVQFLELRPKVAMTLDRSPEEFETLLGIPACRLFIKGGPPSKKAFGILGRGYDMMLVVHEWGASSPSDLLSGLHDIATFVDIEEIGLLAPFSLAKDWREEFRKHAFRIDKNPLCLMYVPERSPLAGEPLKLWNSEGFIWGLDSI